MRPGAGNKRRRDEASDAELEGAAGDHDGSSNSRRIVREDRSDLLLLLVGATSSLPPLPVFGWLAGPIRPSRDAGLSVSEDHEFVYKTAHTNSASYMLPESRIIQGN
jgi:hypothetical protein